jgi:uncharacterized membrane protein
MRVLRVVGEQFFLVNSKYSLVVSSLILLVLTLSVATGTLPGSQAVTPSSGPPLRDFTISPIPNQLFIQPGTAAFSNLTLTSIGVFAGTIVLSATVSHLSGPAPTVSVSPSSVRLRPGVNSSSILLVSTRSTTATGTYTVTVVAQGLEITHTAIVTVLVSPPPDFAFFLAPGSETVALGSSRDSLYTITSLNGFAGMVNVLPTNIPPNVGVGTSGVTVTAGANATGHIFIGVASNAIPGTYLIVFTATSGSLSHTATLTLTISATAVPDFSITTNPLFLTIPDGSTGFVNITLSSIGGFTGNVALTGSIIPAVSRGPIAFVTLPSVFLSPNGKGASLLEIITNTTTPTGPYNYTVTGTSGLLSHSVFGSFAVTPTTHPDFTLSASPSSLAIPQGSQNKVILNLTSTDGFSGTVSLTTTVSPPGPVLVLAIVGNQVTLAAGGTVQVTLVVFTNTTVPIPFGNYNITVTASSGSLAHTVLIRLTVTVPVENLFLGSASFRPTNVTLQVFNTGNMAASLVTYHVQDKAGNTWTRTSWSGPTIGANSTSSVLLTIGVSCPTCTYSGTPGAFTQFTPGNTYTIFLISARNNLYKFSATYPTTTREALSLQSFVFSSGTNVTLFIKNIGNVSVSLVSYYVKDSSGNQYALTTWAGPTTSPNNTALVMILIGSSCPSCTLTGSPFTFNPGFSYTITIVTSRNNQFFFTVAR